MALLFAQATRSGVISVGAQPQLSGGNLVFAPAQSLSGETHGAAVDTFVKEWGFDYLEEISDPSQQFQRFIRMPMESAAQIEARLSAQRPNRRPPLPVDLRQVLPVRWRPARGLPNALHCAPALGAPVSFFDELK
jgi:hypothetical protein